jgi:hypothetical protein
MQQEAQKSTTAPALFSPVRQIVQWEKRRPDAGRQLDSRSRLEVGVTSEIGHHVELAGGMHGGRVAFAH